MKTNTILISILFFLLVYSSKAQITYSKVMTDATGDEFSNLYMDGTDFYYGYDRKSDSIYFQVSVSSMNNAQSQAVGMNVMFNIPGAGSTFNFWGHDNQNAYNRLVTVWVTGTPPSSYSGTIGIADASGVNASSYMNLVQGQIGMRVNQTDKYILIGFPRKNLVPDNLISGESVQVDVAAAVGSNSAWNDDLYQAGAKIPIYKAETQNPTGISSTDESFGLKIYPNPVGESINLPADHKMDQMEIFSLDGKQINSKNIRNLKTIPVNFLQSGVYLLRLKSHDGVFYNQRIVKR